MCNSTGTFLVTNCKKWELISAISSLSVTYLFSWMLALLTEKSPHLFFYKKKKRNKKATRTVFQQSVDLAHKKSQRQCLYVGWWRWWWWWQWLRLQEKTTGDAHPKLTGSWETTYQDSWPGRVTMDQDSWQDSGDGLWRQLTGCKWCMKRADRMEEVTYECMKTADRMMTYEDSWQDDDIRRQLTGWWHMKTADRMMTHEDSWQDDDIWRQLTGKGD